MISATPRGVGLGDTGFHRTNISAVVRAERPHRPSLPPPLHTVEFCLPDTKENFTTSVEPVWRDVQGRMAIPLCRHVRRLQRGPAGVVGDPSRVSGPRLTPVTRVGKSWRENLRIRKPLPTARLWFRRHSLGLYFPPIAFHLIFNISTNIPGPSRNGLIRVPSRWAHATGISATLNPNFLAR